MQNKAFSSFFQCLTEHTCNAEICPCIVQGKPRKVHVFEQQEDKTPIEELMMAFL